MADAGCQVFEDRDGDLVETMCCDYGFRTGSGRIYEVDDGAIPSSGLTLALTNFQTELGCIRRLFRSDVVPLVSRYDAPTSPLRKVWQAVNGKLVQGVSALDKGLETLHILPKLEAAEPMEGEYDPATGEMSRECVEIRAKLARLTLSNDAVWERETARERAGGGVETPWVVRGVYLALCVFLDKFFEDRPIPRFWFLETVARMPYFSYISCLHFYESLGWWRAGAELRKIHFAEEWNELHHLQIMESLGGDQSWGDRFFALHSSIVYYWILVLLFVYSPALAYQFSELIEAHAVDTYGEFADANAQLLSTIPPPLVALQYYRSPDLYMFDEFQTAGRPAGAGPRTPRTKSLYDVFINIRDDEGEHVKTMNACQDTAESVGEHLTERREKPRRI